MAIWLPLRFVALLAVAFVTTSAAPVDAKEEVQFHPTQDPQAERGFYVPVDVEDALRELDRSLSSEFIARTREFDEREAAVELHDGLAKSLRYYWLFSGSRLRDYFAAFGLGSRDEISALLVRAYWRHVNDRSVNVQELVEQALYFQNAVEEPPSAHCPSQPGSQLEVLFRTADGVTFAERRIYYLAFCSSDGAFWTFEYGKGWLPATAEEKAHAEEYLARTGKSHSPTE